VKSLTDVKERGVIFRWGIRIEDKEKLEEECKKPYESTQIYLEGNILLYIPDTEAVMNRTKEETLGVRLNQFVKHSDKLNEKDMKETMRKLA
jgi:hypothetical protein